MPDGGSAVARSAGRGKAPAGTWVQLVPSLTGGVVDYARLLETRLGAARTLEMSPGLLAGSDPLAPENAAVLLHYVGYGYHPRGVPLDLVRAWEAARRGAPGARLGVHFHEVRAFGPPWRSSFWLLPLQRAIARRLLAASDAAATSLPIYRRMLDGLVPGREVAVLPIPSTIGEPESLPEWSERAARLIVFGSEGVRRRAWQGERRAVAAAVRELGLREVVDLGPGRVAPGAVGGVPVLAAGPLPAAEASALLAGSRAGLVAYPPDYLDKSTIHAAYLAHGLVPLCAWSGPRGRPPRTDETWWRATPAGVSGAAGDAQGAAERACAAYSARSLARHAELWGRLLGPA